MPTCVDCNGYFGSVAEIDAHDCSGQTVKPRATPNRSDPQPIVTPEMVAAGWAVIDKMKYGARLRKLGPGPGVREIYETMDKQRPVSQRVIGD